MHSLEVIRRMNKPPAATARELRKSKREYGQLRKFFARPFWRKDQIQAGVESALVLARMIHTNRIQAGLKVSDPQKDSASLLELIEVGLKEEVSCFPITRSLCTITEPILAPLSAETLRIIRKHFENLGWECALEIEVSRSVSVTGEEKWDSRLRVRLT